MVVMGNDRYRAVALFCAALAFPRTAEACGGCFGIGPTVVTGHRMAFAISETQTVLWDQFDYQGDPEDFSWVLPIRPGAYLELADNAWLSALDTFTSALVRPPPLRCARDDDSGGCACSPGFASSSDEASGRASFAPGDGVQVIQQGRVGPYDRVIVRSEDPDALRNWLRDGGYLIPSEIEPVIDAYVAEGNDFLALKLAPSSTVDQMEPVRVITPGGDYLLPLRMVAAGVGSFVTIKLFVIGEGRYTMPDFAEVSVLEQDLVYDYVGPTSNYEELRNAALAQNSGRSALVPFARLKPFNSPNVTPGFGFGNNYTAVNPNGQPVSSSTMLAGLYFAQAAADRGSGTACSPPSALESANLVIRACTGADCPPQQADQISSAAFDCGGYTDLSTALVGMHPNRVWLTRFELNLPSTALDQDCFVEPALEDVEVTPFIQAGKAKNPPCSPPLFTAGMGSALIALTSLGTLLARRRARAGARA